MTDPNRDSDALLQQRFAALRESEATMAPPIPDGREAPLALTPGWTTFAGTATLGRLAAGLAVVALGAGLVVSQTPAQDPGALYTEIMSGQIMETDALLLVSEGVLPAMQDVPGLFEINFEYNADTSIN